MWPKFVCRKTYMAAAASSELSQAYLPAKSARAQFAHIMHIMVRPVSYGPEGNASNLHFLSFQGHSTWPCLMFIDQRTQHKSQIAKHLIFGNVWLFGIFLVRTDTPSWTVQPQYLSQAVSV